MAPKMSALGKAGSSQSSAAPLGSDALVKQKYLGKEVLSEDLMADLLAQTERNAPWATILEPVWEDGKEADEHRGHRCVHLHCMVCKKIVAPDRDSATNL